MEKKKLKIASKFPKHSEIAKDKIYHNNQKVLNRFLLINAKYLQRNVIKNAKYRIENI